MIKYYLLTLPKPGALISFFSELPKGCETKMGLETWLPEKVFELRSQFLHIEESESPLEISNYPVTLIPWEGDKILSTVIDMIVLD